MQPNTPMVTLCEDDNCGYLCDGHGKASIKRLWGSIILVAGLGMEICTYILSIYYPDHMFNVAQNIGETLMIVGGSLLGIGVTEKFFSRKTQ